MVAAQDVIVSDQPDRHRFVLVVDGAEAGELTYRDEDGAVAFLHTKVDDAFGGQGLGSRLVAAALATVRDRGVPVLPYCPFVKAYLKRHPELKSLVPADKRDQFDLA
jgi:predicted GNAT family acetyltransferase